MLMSHSEPNFDQDPSTAEPFDQFSSQSDLASESPVSNTIALGPLNAYRITGRLGAGGMGTIWRAIQVSTKHEVALKILNAGALISEKAKLRFIREVEIACLLDHPNIARVYDSGVQKGACFYAMELVDGVALDEHIGQRNLDLSSALSLMSVICRAVQHAHQKGVIHRDLKPSNILVDKNNNPHIVDFGLGKLLSEQLTSVTITIEGEWAGTPAYMSPEQAAGQWSQVDTRTDIYSLGVILYQMATGRLPHDSEGAHLVVLHRVIHEEIIPPGKCPPKWMQTLKP
jgi:serine/threonine protein kinase